MDNNKEASGGIRFYLMCIVLIVLFVACVICPLIIPNFSQQPYALFMMGAALALPYLYFFIFGGIALAKVKKK